MRKILLLSAFLLAVFLLNAQTWVQKSDFPGTERFSATGFEINGKLYFGTGYNGVTFMTDWWEFDPVTDQWTQKANYPGVGRLHASSFAIGNKGYVLFGSTTVGVYTFPTDVWEYDAINDQWTQKANFPGTGRYTAVAMEINGKGYAGTGWKQFNGPFLNDWWEYDPNTNIWTQKANITGTRRSAYYFSINNKGYVGLGSNGNTLHQDWWEYDPLQNNWIQKANFIGSGRTGGANFVLDNVGYIGTGVNDEFGNVIFTDFFKYDPTGNQWSYVGGFYPGRLNPFACSINSCAYLISGMNAVATTVPTPQNTLKDFWEFCPLTAHITTNDTTVICPGESVLLSANPGACFNYQWQVNGVDISGATGINYTATTSGTYSVIVSNNFGSITSNSIVVTLNSLPAMPGPISGPTIVCSQTLYTYSVPPVPGATGYFWIVSSQSQIFSGQGTNTVTVYFSGTSVKIGVSAINECGLGKQNAIKLNVNNCHDSQKIPLSGDEVKINLFPNPSISEFYINISGPQDEIFILKIRDESGKLIEKRTEIFNNTFTFGSAYNSGIYLIEVHAGKEIYTEKFIKYK
jgi:N-acetylneuraminic acid mutarotase